MLGRFTGRLALLAFVAVVVPAPAIAGEKVVLRAADGRFLRVDRGGTLRPRSFLPGPEETFELDAGAADRVTLTAPDGRQLIFPRSYSPVDRPGEEAAGREGAARLVLLPAANGGFALGVVEQGAREETSTGSGSDRPPEGSAAGHGAQESAPGPGHPAVEVYHAGEIPVGVRSALAAALSTLAGRELSGREYDKTRTRPKKKYIRLPAPTLKHPKRMKRHRVLSYTEQQRVRAALDGPIEILINRMPYLKRYAGPDSKLLLFSFEATVPVRGLVQYKIPERISATAKYRAVVGLSGIGELPIRKADDSVEFDAPKLLRFRVSIGSLDPSNDVLSAMRGTIRDVLNHELADRQERITAKANQALAKAVETRQFKHPVLKLLALP